MQYAAAAVCRSTTDVSNLLFSFQALASAQPPLCLWSGMCFAVGSDGRSACTWGGRLGSGPCLGTCTLLGDLNRWAWRMSGSLDQSATRADLWIALSTGALSETNRQGYGWKTSIHGCRAYEGQCPHACLQACLNLTAWAEAKHWFMNSKPACSLMFFSSISKELKN